jgi:hypothetical protein
MLRKWGRKMADLCPVGRQDDPAFPGVVAEWGAYRLIVARSPDGLAFYFRLQILMAKVGARSPQWVPVEGSSAQNLSKLVSKLAASAVGLEAAVAGLSNDPAKASPRILAAYAALDAQSYS